MKKYQFTFLWVLFCTYAAIARGQEFSELFAGARVMYETQSKDAHYLLVLSPPKKVNSEWVFERSERIQGNVSERTLELPNNYSFQDVSDRLDRFFKGEQGRLLFACSGLDCGSSNAWANEVFGIKQLYGLDPMQEYQVWELSQNDSYRYVISYLVQRGNRRTYLQLDMLIPISKAQSLALTADPKSVLNLLLSDGYYVVPGDVQNLQANAHVRVLAAALKMRPMQKFAIVGHSYAARKPEQRREQSLALAKQLLDQLKALGVREGQLITEGVGALAPQRKSGQQRLELVLM